MDCGLWLVHGVQQKVRGGDKYGLFACIVYHGYVASILDRNKTPRGRAEAMEIIREAGLIFDGQDFDKRRIDEIASNELLHITKLERARGKHMTEHKETVVRREDRLGVFISEQQSKVNSGQVYESAYDLGKDPDNYLAYDSANYPASNPPSTPTSMSANINSSTPIKQKSVSESHHGGHNSDKYPSKERQSRKARSTRSRKAHSQPISAQSASKIHRSHSSTKAHRRFESDLENFRAPRTKGSARSYSPSNF